MQASFLLNTLFKIYHSERCCNFRYFEISEILIPCVSTFFECHLKLSYNDNPFQIIRKKTTNFMKKYWFTLLRHQTSEAFQLIYRRVHMCMTYGLITPVGETYGINPYSITYVHSLPWNLNPVTSVVQSSTQPH